MKRYLYLVEYTITFESGRTVRKNYQVVATSEMNACAKIGQMHSDIMQDKEINIHNIKLVG